MTSKNAVCYVEIFNFLISIHQSINRFNSLQNSFSTIYHVCDFHQYFSLPLFKILDLDNQLPVGLENSSMTGDSSLLPFLLMSSCTPMCVWVYSRGRLFSYPNLWIELFSGWREHWWMPGCNFQV
jgi:hypothetical protein